MKYIYNANRDTRLKIQTHCAQTLHFFDKSTTNEWYLKSNQTDAVALSD